MIVPHRIFKSPYFLRQLLKLLSYLPDPELDSGPNFANPPLKQGISCI